jgi:hypothetical protein
MTTSHRPFLIDEGAFTVPEGFQDRSTNIFIHGNPESSLLNLNIGRDNHDAEETLEQYVTRQIKLLNDKLPGYKLKSRAPAKLGANERTNPIEGEQIDGGYKNGGRFLHQRQAAFPMSATRVLIFSATSGEAFNDAFETMWAQWLGSFAARPENDGIKE